MQVGHFQFSYCSNIHPGESWEATFENLKSYIPQIRENLQWKGAFGIGLRLSNEASLELEKKDELAAFQSWLAQENAYVFTLNGFPYGDFHHTRVKDQVHFPDWTTDDRKNYTIRSFRILAQLLPDGMSGGISTSPISYRHWFKTPEEKDDAMQKATANLMEVVAELAKIQTETGKTLHLDIEPEPDGILENSDEMLWLFDSWLIPKGAPILSQKLGITLSEAEILILEHIQVCYDVCHFAIVYEHPANTFSKFNNAGIKIGKIQISAALKLDLGENRAEIQQKLLPFAESTYLHQVVGRKADGSLVSYSDLPEALEAIQDAEEKEWRIHFHVPLFVESYGQFFSTQSSILNVLSELRNHPEITEHLEVETYTWEVLPDEMRLELGESISRELEWVLQRLE
ncbi:metabolite traffic protein EboE [Algoriphagus limi]|uniref:Metabolite traffic protein EboE n=1 Tax=Algoriphagus limi TaxID=2975273 RepID=A0ABT2G959_9BACT|nr:metabolite traffic protein EboE [Algoriphagus limi]MCS5491288.1 metabolite traffic protein EboE [Algoriphagus limi]